MQEFVRPPCYGCEKEKRPNPGAGIMVEDLGEGSLPYCFEHVEPHIKKEPDIQNEIKDMKQSINRLTKIVENLAANQD